jgi:hypothetical protein
MSILINPESGTITNENGDIIYISNLSQSLTSEGWLANDGNSLQETSAVAGSYPVLTTYDSAGPKIHVVTQGDQNSIKQYCFEPSGDTSSVALSLLRTDSNDLPDHATFYGDNNLNSIPAVPILKLNPTGYDYVAGCSLVVNFSTQIANIQPFKLMNYTLSDPTEVYPVAEIDISAQLTNIMPASYNSSYANIRNNLNGLASSTIMINDICYQFIAVNCNDSNGWTLGCVIVVFEVDFASYSSSPSLPVVNAYVIKQVENTPVGGSPPTSYTGFEYRDASVTVTSDNNILLTYVKRTHDSSGGTPAVQTLHGCIYDITSHTAGDEVLISDEQNGTDYSACIISNTTNDEFVVSSTRRVAANSVNDDAWWYASLTYQGSPPTLQCVQQSTLSSDGQNDYRYYITGGFEGSNRYCLIARTTPNDPNDIITRSLSLTTDGAGTITESHNSYIEGHYSGLNGNKRGIIFNYPDNNDPDKFPVFVYLTENSRTLVSCTKETTNGVIHEQIRGNRRDVHVMYPKIETGSVRPIFNLSEQAVPAGTHGFLSVDPTNPSSVGIHSLIRTNDGNGMGGKHIMINNTNNMYGMTDGVTTSYPMTYLPRFQYAYSYTLDTLFHGTPKTYTLVELNEMKFTGVPFSDTWSGWTVDETFMLKMSSPAIVCNRSYY